ncbi:MAG: dethiobiotin synthase, partial [Nitrospiria bacterium]
REDLSDGSLLKKEGQSELPMDCVSPYRFKTPADPIVASGLEKKKIKIPLILKKYNQLALNHDWMIVEGAGGLMVPILKGFDMADLILSLNLGVILVASDRLGTINHALLSLHLAENRGIKILAIILNHRKSREDPATQANASILQEKVKVPVLTYSKKAPAFSEESFWKKLLT